MCFNVCVSMFDKIVSTCKIKRGSLEPLVLFNFSSIIEVIGSFFIFLLLYNFLGFFINASVNYN